ncbi:DNA-binding CsgD family transcriptional regulator [Arthrobacter sp. 2762]
MVIADDPALVRNHLSAAMAKTGGRTRAEAVRIAADNGWLL